MAGVTVGKEGKNSSRQNVDCVLWLEFARPITSQYLGLVICLDQSETKTVWVNIKPSLPTQIYQEMNTLHSKTVPSQTLN